MSRHWDPQDEVARSRRMRARTWPAGATVGLALIAAACVGVVATLYWVAGPRVVVEDEAMTE